MLEVLSDLASRLAELEDVLTNLPIRMRGGSVLVVTEGDPASLASALERENAALACQSTSAPPADEEESDSESVESSDSQGQALPQTCRSLEVRLIDFAHTRLADVARGERGGDKGVLLGIGTLRGYVDRIRARVSVVVDAGHERA